MAPHCIVAVSLLAFASAEVRQLSYAKIAGYEPGSDVTQHNRLDLDQQEMEKFLGLTTPDFVKAKAIYNTGAHSGAYARMTVSALSANLNKSAAVVQASNSAATGYAKSAKAQGSTQVDVTYTSTCIDNQASASYSIAGCYKTTGEVTAGGSLNMGTPSAVSNKYRNLAGFSTAAGAKMAGQATFEKFKAYYVNPDYGHRYVTAALDGSGAFTNKAAVVRVEGTKKGSAYMNVWMYVVREFEDALDDCKAGCVNCNDDPVHAWDEGVAFYTGSLQGAEATAGAGSGKMLYALANKRCKNYNTCGASGTAATGNSKVNIDILTQFKLGQAKLLAGKCSEIGPIRDAIIKLMTVPLVQGALRYAYKVANQQGGDKEKAEGAVFSAAVLPLVHSCSAAAATTISNNMKVDAAAPMSGGYAAVKQAFESTYTCLGITCAQVGGLIVTGTTYHTGAEPCGAGATTTTGTGTATTTTTGTQSVSSTSAIAFSKVLIMIAAFTFAAY